MEQKLFYLELSNEPIRFDAVSQLTNVFFDDSNRQVFAIRSGGATGCCVKGPGETDIISFCMEDKGPIRSIKFSPNNKILAIQRTDTSVDFVNFVNNQPQMNDMVVYKGKNVTIHGFVWVHEKEVAVISNGSVEMVVVNMEKKQAKCLKSISLTINWFMWYSPGNLSVLATNNGTVLIPVILKQGTITKLPKLEPQCERGIPERDVTLAQIYGTFAILILRPTETRTLSVVIYLLNGPGLAPKKSHVLCLGHSGRFAINIVDDLVVVHHQATGTSMLFDIALSGETDSSGVIHHTPITPGRPIKPFSLKMPSLSFDGETKKCELYSPNWVLFQPNIVIDAKLGCMWYIGLNLKVLSDIITDRLRLVELLLQRTHGKSVLMSILTELMSTQYSNALLPVIEKIFDKLNVVYKDHVNAELQNQIAQPSFAKQQSMKTVVPPRVLIDQNDLYTNVFAAISETAYCNKILMTYIHSLAKHKIAAQHDLSKMIIVDLVRHKKLDTLRALIALSLLHESKPLACFLLSLSSVDDSITQMALDMLHKLKANSIIVEVLLGQGKIIDSLRLAKSLPGGESTLSARKYLEAAIKCDPLLFYSVYSFFQQRNVRLRGTPDFLKSELCNEYIEYYQNVFLQIK